MGKPRTTVLPENGAWLPCGEDTATMTITDKLARMAADIPMEEREKLPSDLADQHDHYAYRWPRH